MTNKNGKSVRLSADFNLDTETVYYKVYCDGVTFEFKDFAPAASMYKSFSDRIEHGTYSENFLRNRVSAAAVFGYKVTEAK